LPPNTTSGSERTLTEVEPAVTGTQRVFRALSILRAFTPQQPTLSGPEVAEKFGFSQPTAYRLLRALEAENFLVFDRGSRAYGPGPEILRLAGVLLHRDAFVVQTQSSLTRLRALTGETVAVYWRLGNKCTCTQELPSPHPQRVEAGIGVGFPLTRGPAGKAMLLDLDEAGVRALLAEPDIPAPVGGVDALLAELEQGRNRGYLAGVDETIEGAVTIAAPIPWVQPGLAVYTVSAPESRFDPQTRETAARTLVEEMERLRAILRKQNPFTM
jgi:DNA-binding IclR family transcriptional regulator